MNHLRKLALLSSLALSFVAYGDGTLPLPVVLDGDFTQLAEVAGSPLSLNLQRENASPSVPNIPGYGNPCDVSTDYVFRSVSGTVKIGNDVLNVYGVCNYLSADPFNTAETKFAIVATKAQTLSIMNVKTVTKVGTKWKNLAGQLELDSPEANVSGTFNLKAN
jgi:hypothetical protein